MRAPLLIAEDAAALELRRWQGPAAYPRTEMQLDRDRILYSSAFKRLAHVTQVTASETGLTFHSRLTHSLKVAQFARRLAERLKARAYTGAAARVADALDVDAAEAAALAHDIGHPPFGHLAEQELDQLAARFGGFEGNAQSFRILTRLALLSDDHVGLNLTRKTLNGILKYPWLRDDEDAAHYKKWNVYFNDRADFEWVREPWEGQQRSIEAEVMDWADDVTYAVHDMDDFYRAGLVPLDRLCQRGRELDAFNKHLQAVGGERAEDLRVAAEHVFTELLTFEGPYAGTSKERINLRVTGSNLIRRYIDAPSIETEDGGAVFVIDDQLRDEVDALKQLIWFYVIEHPTLGILQRGQRHIITSLFEIYHGAALSGEWRLFPALYTERLRTASTHDGKRRAVVDLISSMTEAGAAEVYRRLTGVVAASISDPTGRLV